MIDRVTPEPEESQPGVDLILAMGAIAGFAITFETGSVWLGVLGGMAAGALMSYLFAVVVLTLMGNQVATGLALLLAYLNTRTDIPFKFLFRIISIIPMMIPHILFSVSWVLLLNPSNGLINLFLRRLPGFEDLAINIYSLPGMILVEGLLDLPDSDFRPYLLRFEAGMAIDAPLRQLAHLSGAVDAALAVRLARLRRTAPGLPRRRMGQPGDCHGPPLPRGWRDRPPSRCGRHRRQPGPDG